MNTQDIPSEASRFFEAQLDRWHEAAGRFRDLKEQCKIKELTIGSNTLKAQYNPARSRSAQAKTDSKSINERPCFLCAANRPEEQMHLDILEGYQLLVNPFPILPVHFTIASSNHRPQEILTEFPAYQTLLGLLPQYIVFYNGPRCGASAPDHLHFQAGSKGIVPIEASWKSVYEPLLEPVAPEASPAGKDRSIRNGLFLLRHFPTPVFVLRTSRTDDAMPLFRTLYEALSATSRTDGEPMLNLLGWQDGTGEQTILVFPRSKHRPDAYFQSGDGQMLISPGAIDMGGLLICAREEDYARLKPESACHILAEVGMSTTDTDSVCRLLRDGRQQLPDTEPEIQVGILHAPELTFTLHGTYRGEGKTCTGDQTVCCRDGQLVWQGASYPTITLRPDGEGIFSLPEVMIGIKFHWQKKETQTFTGGILLKAHEGEVVLINLVRAEAYLSSVICSEMNADSPFEFLKAAAIISRSWVLSQILRKKQGGTSDGTCGSVTEHEIIRWYEQSDHKLFDVCADDHCQRYQGIGRITSGHSLQAVNETRGEVLLFEDRICDARFSKCCGGMTEGYEYCWDDTHVPYLIAHSDRLPSVSGTLNSEDEARKWIDSSPECFCNTSDRLLLQRILNGYDQRTQDFFRWQITYSQDRLAGLLKRKSGIDFGEVLDIRPIERGPGGHLSRIEIVGTRNRRIIGKELEIRRILSETHLYSSAFIVEKGPGQHGIPQEFTFRGAGWGHGVGMCQIGAAIMGQQGYDYRSILKHYYPDTTIKKLY